MIANLLMLCAAAAAVAPVYEADFSAASKNMTPVNYAGRTPPVFVQRGGKPAVEFAYVPRGNKADTMWGVESEPVAVKPGAEFVVLVEMEGDIPPGAGRPGGTLTWYGKDGKKLMVQDALGRIVAQVSPLNVPARRSDRGAARAFTKGVVPDGAATVKIVHKVDLPDLKAGHKVAFRRMAYYERKAGGPAVFDDIEAPRLEILTRSPSADFNEPIRFRLTDKSGVNWAETKVRIDGAQIAPTELRKEGDVFVYASLAPWERDSIHCIEVEAADLKDNVGSDCGFVAFTEKKPAHPKCTVRDDGMLVLDGKPIFPLGWCRVRPCEGNDYSLDKGLADMKANGMNIAHTYMVHANGSEKEDVLFDELVAACEKHGVMLYTEPANRKPRSERFLPLMRENLFRGLGYKAPLFWGIGDDTSMHLSPDDLKYIYRCCKAVDPDALTISADVWSGPGGHTAYAPYVDILLLESYPIVKETPEDNELAKAAYNLDCSWNATLAAKVPGRTVMALPQAFKGWTSWKRLPTPEEVRCQAYLAIAGRSRGLVYYASCGNKYNVNVPPPPGQKVELKNWGPLNIPAYKESFFALMRELDALVPSLVLRDAKRQPSVRIVKGEALNGLGNPAILCLMKEDGLLVAANSSHLPVTAEFTLADGSKVVHEFPRNGVFVKR